MAENSTLFKSPPNDASKSLIENLLELTLLTSVGADIFTNTRRVYRPPGARGIYGGAVVGQSLTAAQFTVPQNFIIHSMHCYFVMTGDSSIPITYHVERLRDGRSYMTRTVQAKQHGKCIYTTTMSFVKDSADRKLRIHHAVTFPKGVEQPKSDETLESEGLKRNAFVKYYVQSANQRSESLHERNSRMWMKTSDKISEAGGCQAHVAALAYMSDSHFIGTIARAHDVWLFGKPLCEEIENLSSVDDETKARAATLEKMQRLEKYEVDLNNKRRRPELGMMVSLDHTIYFYEPKRFRADEWLLADMSTPWSGHERGVVMQHIFAQDGTLVASCYQEGVVRLKDVATPKI